MGLRSILTARLLLAGGVAVIALRCASHQRLVHQDEGVILADLNAVLNAEAVYHAGNDGYYGPLACLAAPWSCIPHYPRSGPAMLGTALAELRPENGYVRRFYPGPPPPGPVPLRAYRLACILARQVWPPKGKTLGWGFLG